MSSRRDRGDRIRERGLFLLLLALCAAAFYLLNVHTPLMMDDYDYSFSWATGRPLSGVRDVIASQIAHYRIWGGRSVTHTLVQLFLYWGKGVFNLANTAAYAGLLLEICYLSGSKGARMNWRTLLLANAALMWLVPFYGVVFLWLDGACNYLFGTALALTPLMIALSEREGGFFDAGAKRGFLALPVCFIAGWTNENTACGVLAAVLLLIAWDMYAGRKVRPWRIAAALLETAGVLLMLLAPGNFARAGEAASRSLIAELMYRFAVTTYCVLRYAGVPALLALVLFVCLRRKHINLPWLQLAVQLGAAFLCAYALVASPQISDRSFTGVFVLVLCVLLTLFAQLPHTKARSAALGCALAAVLAASAAALGDVKAHGAAWDAQLAAAAEAKAQGDAQVTLQSVPSVSRFTMSIALEQDTKAWPNSTLSKALGIEVYGK